MGNKLNRNAVNQIEKGTVIYQKNDDIDSICLVLKGRVLAENDGSKVVLGSGSFLGICDFYMGRFLNSYIAYDDVTFYCFSLEQKDELDGIFMTSKDYKGLAIASLVKYINELIIIHSNLSGRVSQIYNFITRYNELYMSISNKLGYTSKQISGINELVPYNNQVQLDSKKMLYYKDCTKVSLDVWKTFLSEGNGITSYLMEDMSNYIIELSVECEDMSNYVVEIFEKLISKNEGCLFKSYATLAITIDDAGGNNKEIINYIDAILEQINITEKLFNEKIGLDLVVDREHMEEIYYLLLSKSNNRKDQVESNFAYTQNEMNEVNKQLHNSLEQILTYAKLDNESKDKFKQLLLDYVNLKDRHSTDDSTRALRKRITEKYYEIYESVFFLAYVDKNIPKAIDLFLKYGFLDENFLTKEQIRDLYYLKDQNEEQEYVSVYNIKDWLIAIYEGKKEPSKNEFDLDYNDYLRNKRKRAEITELEEKQLQTDFRNKVTYEIYNMFRYNNRLVNGQISTFVPFLHGDNMIHGIERLYVDTDKINTAFEEILEIDYSAFYRESMYINNEKGIIKEYIMEEIVPDVILMPIQGVNGVMWQDISGKRKSSKGRFLLPTFSEVSIKDVLIKLVGRFRWELCRSIQGSAWNNIKYKSLTSEYSDYIQFYRKNRELSEEVKEKLKLQIQKGKGNYREIFILDYEAWIKGESNGALRLNRVGREILATYCPFSKPIRERLVGQPLFADAIARFNRNTHKKCKELELRYRALEKEGIEITKELKDTLTFYSDL